MRRAGVAAVQSPPSNPAVHPAPQVAAIQPAPVAAARGRGGGGGDGVGGGEYTLHTWK